LLLLPGGQENIIALVVDDTDDDEFAEIVATENMVPSERFGGAWGNGQRDGHWLVAFQLIERGAGAAGVQRQWFTSNIHRELLDAILQVPHLVALLPAELAGDATTLEDFLPRLGGSVLVGVEHRSDEVAQVRAERE
jgi:hypothetical protein